MYAAHEEAPVIHINPYQLFVNAPLPLWLLENREISAGAKLCYARLALFAGKTGVAWCRQDSLARTVGISDRHVRRCLIELTKMGLIDIERGGSNKVNHYRFRWQPIIEITGITMGEQWRDRSPYREGQEPPHIAEERAQ